MKTYIAPRIKQNIITEQEAILNTFSVSNVVGSTDQLSKGSNYDEDPAFNQDNFWED